MTGIGQQQSWNLLLMFCTVLFPDVILCDARVCHAAAV